MEALTKNYFALAGDDRSFFIVERNPSENSFTHSKLADKIDAVKKDENFADKQMDEIYFCFSDPCPNVEYGGWPLRLFLLMLTHLWYVFTFIGHLQQAIYK